MSDEKGGSVHDSPSPLVERANASNEEDHGVAAVVKGEARRPKNLSVNTIADVPNENLPPPEDRHDRRDTVCLLRHMEEKIGCCLEEFRCQHNNFTGILYVGPLGAIFLGRFLLFEWTVVLRWEDVLRVRRLTASEDSAIRIETKHTIPEASVAPSGGGIEVASNIYDFEGFASGLVLQTALETLMGLHNDTILDQDRVFRKVTSRGSIKAPFRRSISDPAGQMSELFRFDDLPLGEDDDGDDTESSGVPVPPPESPADSAETFGTPRRSRDAAEAAGNNNGNAAADTDPDDDDDDKLGAEWIAKCDEVDDTYCECVVRDLELPLENLDAFADAFVRDDATFSWSRYMEDVSGEADVQAEPWVTTTTTTTSTTSINDTKTNSSEPVVSTRTIEYTHPVNAPMAPPTARAQKTQILREYGPDRGLVLETKTFVQDVPMTDCFYVRDVVRVRKDTDRKDRLVVTIRFEIVFVKSTMFRGLITRQTTSEFVAFLAGLADYTSGNCPTTTTTTEENTTKLPAVSSSSSSSFLPPIECSLTEDEISAEWAGMCLRIAAHPEAPVVDREITLPGGNLDAFLGAFLADDAGHSWSRYMTEIVGDSDVAATEWVAAASNDDGDDDDDGACAVPGHTRTIRYIHPVNAPMAPPTARARKEQTLWRFGPERGLVLETKTFVEGVPKTDCFYVRDVLKVHPSTAHQDRLVVNFRFEIVFVKSTLFRSLISKTTAGEFTKFTTQLADYFSKHYGSYTIRSGGGDDDEALAAGSSSKEDSTPNEKLPEPQPRPIVQPTEYTGTKHNNKISKTVDSGSISRKFELGWRIVVVVMLLWIAQIQNRVWNEAMLVQRDVRELRSRIRDLEAARESDMQRQETVWKEWTAAFAEQEAARVSGARSLRDDWDAWKEEQQQLSETESRFIRDELRDLKSVLSERGCAAATATAPDDPTTTGRKVRRQPEQGSETWSSKARQAATSGIKRPRIPFRGSR